MPRNKGTSRKGKPGKIEIQSGMGRSLYHTSTIRQNQYKPRMDGKNILGGSNGMAALPGVNSINIDKDHMLLIPTNTTVAATSVSATTNTSATNQHPRSILELDDIDDFLYQANLAQQEFISIRGGVDCSSSSCNMMMNRNNHELTVISMNTTNRKIRFADEEEEEEVNNNNNTSRATKVMELSVPRRPQWDTTMTKEQLEVLEQEAFLQWRRQIAQYEHQVQQAQQHHRTPINTSTTTTTFGTTIGSTAITPFEKNIYVWKQLWRVLERCDVLIQIVDARNPLFYISRDLIQYVCVELHKPMIVLCNKSDYLTSQQRSYWYQYFTTTTSSTAATTNMNNNNNNNNNSSDGTKTTKTTSSTIKDNITVLFFSAVQEQKILDDTAKKERDAIAAASLLHQQQQHQQTKDDNDPYNSIPGESDEDDEDSDDDDDSNNNDDDDSDSDASNDNNSKDKVDNVSDTNRKIDDIATSVLDKDYEHETPLEGEDKIEDDDTNVKLLSRDELITRLRTIAQQYNCTPQERYDYRIQYGMVGFPNVGKSSVINVLVGNSKYIHNTVRVGVASQPGKTKHFQTLLSDHTDIMLCDCPGLVFPSFVSNTADLIAAGVYPISQMRDYYSVIQLICSRIPRHILNAHYGIQLPIPSKQDIQDRTGYSDSNTTSNSTNAAALSTTTTVDRIPNPTVDELLTTYCISRGLLASFSGVPDYQRAARIIVKDYADGKLLYCHPPPTLLLDNDDNNPDGIGDTNHSKQQKQILLQEFYNDTIQTALRNTQRTQERLLKQQQKLIENGATTNNKTKKGKNKGTINPITARTTNQITPNDTNKGGTASVVETDDPLNDELLLQMMMGTTNISSTTTNTDNSKKQKQQATTAAESNHKHHFKRSNVPKWGKKDRKNRNKDPYGCHSFTPDSALLSL